MAIKIYKPTTNGRRHMTSSDFAEITKTKPEKTLLESQSHTAGRNSCAIARYLAAVFHYLILLAIVQFERTKY